MRRGTGALRHRRTRPCSRGLRALRHQRRDGETVRRRRACRARDGSAGPDGGRRLARLRLAGALLRLAYGGEAWPAASDRGGDTFSVDTVVMTPELLGAVIDVLIWNAEHLEVDARAAFGQEFAHRGAEATCDDVLLDGHEARDPGGQGKDPLGVQRLREPRVHDRRLEAVLREDVGRLE